MSYSHQPCWIRIIINFYESRGIPRKKEYKYGIEVDSNKIIKYFEFIYCMSKRANTKVWLVVNGITSHKKSLKECPCIWQINEKVTKLELVSNRKLIHECMKTNIVYDEIWTIVGSGENYPLPSTPSKISHIEFDGKCNMGTTSYI